MTQELLSLKNCRTAFVGHVTKLICKIETCIFNSDKVEKILCLKFFVSRKRVKAELLLKQSYERFERKSKLLEKQNSLELELEREKIIEAENQLKLLELKDACNLDK